MPDENETLTGVKTMSERKAILKVGYTQFVTDVSLALVLEEHLSKLTQISSHWVDPDDHPDVEPNGLVLCATDTPVSIDAELVSKTESVVEDPEWWPAAKATMEANKEQIQNDKELEASLREANEMESEL